MPDQSTDVGARLRRERQRRRLSLREVASRAGISVATLSRIETSKQSIDVALLMALADILGAEPSDFFGRPDDGQNVELLAQRLASLRPADRAQLLRASRPARRQELGAVVDDLLATLDIVRDELEQVARSGRKRRKR